ncbi:MAG: histidinol dehydrogenase [Vulcanimicrobiaceae bacterium]
MKIISASDREALGDLYRGGWDPPEEIRRGVAEIIGAVRARGDEALVEYARRFDDPTFNVSRIRVPIPMREQAQALVPREIADGLRLAQERIARFHRQQRPEGVAYADEDGTSYRFSYRPLDSVAAYVPGGSATLPSSVLMSVVPAKIAGVSRVVVLTPAQRDGRVAPAVVFACSLCEVEELHAVGGAAAIAAAAYGTQSIARVDKIVGPGNVWVTEAKRQVYGACAIDGLAGPSEILVVADDGASAEYVVGELLAQAEHDPLARVAVVSESLPFLQACAQLLEATVLNEANRGAIVRRVLEDGTYLVHARNRKRLFEVVERFAPEHLSLQVRDPERYLARVRNAGAVFIGPNTPVACGDYLAGTNHVLPTSGAARFSSGLRTADFLRSFSILENSAERMRADAPVLAALAEFEGLHHHAETARMRQAP